MTVAGFPSGARYVEALQNTQVCFKDTELRGASPWTDRLGRPRAISGNFASVFSLTATNGRRYAVKCFTREVVDQELRYQAVSDHLAGLRCAWKVSFDYLCQGVLVEGKWYPALKMEWVNAITLTSWIEQHLHQPGALAQLACHFANLVADLTANDIGHGDLQHGNLLVAPDGTLRLVDYDGMYVPALAGLPAAEAGHRNYQPPGRSAADFGPRIDKFSAWVVYLSLIGLAVDPALWGQLRERDAEHLLLAEDDYATPTVSYRLNVLTSHSDEIVRSLAGQLRTALIQPSAALPELAPVGLDCLAPPTPVSAFPRAQSTLPGWMSGHVDAEPCPPRNFANRAKGIRALGVAVMILTPLAVLATVLGAGAALFPPLVLGLFWFAWSVVAYRRQPETAHAMSARAQALDANKAVSVASRTVAQLEARTRELEQAADNSKALFTSRQQDLRAKHQHALAAAQRETQQALTAVEHSIRRLTDERTYALNTELGRIQDEHIRAQLSRLRITDAKLTGIGPKLVGNLRSAGIVTAADFTGVSYSAGQQYNSRTAHFGLRNGYRVRVEGIGEVKAGRLDDWRRTHLARVRATQPAVLSPAITQAIESRFTPREAALRDERRHVAAQGDQRRDDLTAKYATEQASLSAELRKANADTARAKAEQEGKAQQMRAALTATQRRHRDALANARSHAAISYRGFVRFTMTGRVGG